MEEKIIKFLRFLFSMTFAMKNKNQVLLKAQSHANSWREWWVAYLLNAR